MSYDSVLHVCELCGDEVCREFFGEPNSSPHEKELNNRQFLWPPPLVRNEATIDSVLLAAIQQFEDQATSRLLIAVLHGAI